MQKTMYNACKDQEFLPIKIPGQTFQNIEEFGAYLQENPDCLKANEEDAETFFNFKLVHSSSKSYHLILYNKELFEECVNSTEIFSDATFDVKPSNIKKVLQMFTIMVKKNGIVSVFQNRNIV